MMDQATEAKVIEVLGSWLKGRTLVLSTHRLQLLVWVEKIALLDQGRILLEGPRDEVLQKLSAGSASGTSRSARHKPASKASAATPLTTATV
jgi:ATP-binding cassette subfamily C protein LapB